jgi:bifunctional non-homologous end joining protein LigD
MFHRGQPFFYAFDLLWLNGEDLRGLPLLHRKAQLRKLVGRSNRGSCISTISNRTDRAYTKACEFDLEGIVAKWKGGLYIADDRRSSVNFPILPSV